MKKFQLSTPGERALGILFSFIFTAALIVLVIAVRQDLTMFIATALGAVLIIVVLALYVVNVTKAACYVDVENRTLRVTGLRERNIDLSTAKYLQTLTVKNGHVEGRSLAFSDAEDGVIAVVPTYFTSKRGALAEPMAMEIAKELGLEFISNVPAWRYDKEARKAHEIEMQQQEKEDAKKRREGKKALREAKIRQKMEKIRNEEK